MAAAPEQNIVSEYGSEPLDSPRVPDIPPITQEELVGEGKVPEKEVPDPKTPEPKKPASKKKKADDPPGAPTKPKVQKVVRELRVSVKKGCECHLGFTLDEEKVVCSHEDHRHDGDCDYVLRFDTCSHCEVLFH